MAAYAPPGDGDADLALRTGWFTQAVHQRGTQP